MIHAGPPLYSAIESSTMSLHSTGRQFDPGAAAVNASEAIKNVSDHIWNGYGIAVYWDAREGFFINILDKKSFQL